MKKEVLKAIIFMSIGAGMMQFFKMDKNPNEIQQIAKQVDFNQFKSPDEAKKLFDGITKQMHRVFKDQLKVNENVQADLHKALNAMRSQINVNTKLKKSETDTEVLFQIDSKFINPESFKVQVENNEIKVTGKVQYFEKKNNQETEYHNDFVEVESLPSNVGQHFQVEIDDTRGLYKIIFKKI